MGYLGERSAGVNDGARPPGPTTSPAKRSALAIGGHGQPLEELCAKPKLLALSPLLQSGYSALRATSWRSRALFRCSADPKTANLKKRSCRPENIEKPLQPRLTVAAALISLHSRHRVRSFEAFQALQKIFSVDASFGVQVPSGSGIDKKAQYVVKSMENEETPAHRQRSLALLSPVSNPLFDRLTLRYRPMLTTAALGSMAMTTGNPSLRVKWCCRGSPLLESAF